MTTMRQSQAWWPLLAGVSLWSWQAACLVAGLHVGLVTVRLLVEAQRRQTLLGLVERAPAGTMVVMAETSELPAVCVQVGRGPCASALRSTHDAPDP